MFGNCFGVLFSEFFLKLNTSSTKVSEIFNLAFALSSFFSFLTGPLVELYGWRRVTLVASLVYSLGLASSAVATSASFFFVFTILLAGLCILLLEVIAQHTVSLYFTSKRRLATCIVTLGTCASQVLLTPLITWLQGEVSHRGATLLMAALALNCCVAAMFLHPVEWHKKERLVGYPEVYVEKSNLSPNLSPLLSPISPGAGFISLPESSLRNVPGQRDRQVETGTLSPSLSPKLSPFIKSTIPGDGGFLQSVENERRERHVSFADDYLEKHASSSSPKPKTSHTIGGGILRLAQTSLRNLRYFRSPRIALTSMILACNASSLVNIWAIVPFALKSDGYSSQEVALCLSVAGLCNTASRLTNGVLSCWAAFTVQRLYIIGSAMSALGIIGFSMVEGLAWKMVLFGVCGLGNGTVSTLYSLVAVEAEGLHLQLPVLSLAGLITGLWFLLVDPLTGLVRDLSGSYSVCLGVLGGFLLASLALWLLMPAPARKSLPQHRRSESRPLVRPAKASKDRFTAQETPRLQMHHQREI